MNLQQRQLQNRNQSQEQKDDQSEESVRLNLGSGHKELDGYINIDIKNDDPAYPLEFDDGSVDEIRASHILEHFSHRDIAKVISNWVSKLKPGGIMKIAVPDFRKIAERYLQGKKVNAVGYIMGGHADENDRHGSIFDQETLVALMRTAGLGSLRKWESETKDCADLLISLNLMGKKMTVDQKRTWIPEGIKIAAIMSAPRFGPIDNMLCALNSFAPLGIKFQVEHGAYWSQVLECALEKFVDEGSDWIFVTDYDSWFTYRHVIRLCQLMRDNSNIDGLVSVEIKREGELPMIGMDERNTPMSRFDCPLTDIKTGNFGLALLRVSALRKMTKPWFLPVPDKNNGWHEGRIDADIYFWRKFTDEGFRVCQANEVNIGHMQLFCTFPGEPKDTFKPIHLPLSVLEKDGPPAHCQPQIEFIDCEV